MNEQEKLLFASESKTDDQKIVCLGLNFNSENERREYFRNELRKKLPQLKEIEGFPIGEDEDIIALSDPPYYTACPNPWINDYIEEWEKEKSIKSNLDYHREPYSTDISEGKNDPIYNAHSYHTKVPYKAIMRYLLYYTNPGDIIFDGFSGSGMTGVASQLCGDEEHVKELGYTIDEQKNIIDTELNIKTPYRLGARRSILMDLSPAATFIGHNYNKAVDIEKRKVIIENYLQQFRNENIWKFSTLIESSNDNLKSIDSLDDAKKFYFENSNYFAEINYIVWSEFYQCSSCIQEFSYWESAYEEDYKIAKKLLKCPHCGAESEKKHLHKVFEYKIDVITKKKIRQPKILPVKINYTLDKKRYNKSPDLFDISLISLLQNSSFELVPKTKINKGIKTTEPIKIGMDYVHHFYTERILSCLNSFIKIFQNTPLDDYQFLLGSTLPKLTKMNRFMPQHGSRSLVGPMANALYFPPLSVENNAVSQIEFQFKKIIKAWNNHSGNIISTQSSTSTNLKKNSIDYIFIDPPFGANIMYSELSFPREAWLKVLTNNEKEAIENSSQSKDLNEYTKLMMESFKECFRILKPNHWMTVEFSNTQSRVWNSIQYGIQEAGFVIASVDALNKKRGGLHAMLTNTAVKQDLVISAYKPSSNLVEKMKSQTNSSDSAWMFINQHLEKLPVFLGEKNQCSIIIERTPRILFDRMVAFHIQNNLPVPLSSTSFQAGLIQRFPIRDEMVFLEAQVVEYDKKRISIKEFSQLTLFVSDESSAIEWIRQRLIIKPQSRQDLHPYFIKEIQHIAKHEQLPELDDLLSQNFLRFDDEEGSVPTQILTYLRRNYPDLRGLDASHPTVIKKALHRWYVPDPNKQADLEKLREKALLREFNLYVEEITTSKKKLKVFRMEAIRAGFKKAWSEKDFQTIIIVGDRLPETIIQEDDKLLMYYDNAQIKLDM